MVVAVVAVAHVLLVEDERLVAEVFRAALEDEGHRVTTAGDGVAALAAHALDPADLLVTDLRMPRMGGAELAVLLRERTPGLPVLVLSGCCRAGGVVDGLGDPAAGLTILLGKPVSPRLLAREVAAMLAARGAVDGAVGAAEAGPAYPAPPPEA